MVPIRIDDRDWIEVNGARVEAENRPLVLVVLPSPTEFERKSGQALVGSQHDFLLDFLTALDFRWAAMYLYPDYDTMLEAIKTGTRDALDRFWRVVRNLSPNVVMSCGSNVLKALWPPGAGKPTSIHKARATPLEIAPGLLCVWAYDPMAHHKYLQTDGRYGKDLVDDLCASFQLVSDIAEGTYRQPVPTYTVIDTPAGLAKLAQRIAELNPPALYLDVEDATWIGSGNVQPHKWPPDVPSKLTIRHPGNRLLLLGLTIPIWCGGRVDYETYCILPHLVEKTPRQECPPLLQSLLTGRHLEAWNMDYDWQALDWFGGYDVYDPVNQNTLGDGMVAHYEVDQSVPGNGLKALAMNLLSFPAWDLEVRSQLELARKRNRTRWGSGMNAASFDQVSPTNLYLYNAFDTFANARLVEEYFADPLKFTPPENCKVYDFLVDKAAPAFASMTRTGILINTEQLSGEIRVLESDIHNLKVKILRSKYTRKAGEISGKEFNPRSPLWFRALVAVTHGKAQQANGSWDLEFPDWIPRTKKTNALQRSTSVIRQLAGLDPETGVLGPGEKQNAGQKLWHKIHDYKLALDKLGRFLTLQNYIVGDRIHPTYRLVKAAVPSEDILTAGDKSGGSVSGRTSTTPNMQNDANDPRVKRLFGAPPGFLVVQIDYDRSELIWLAFNTKDTLYREWAVAGLDQHLRKGIELWKVKTSGSEEYFHQLPPEKQKRWRAIGKTMNFATVYLQEPQTTAAMMGVTVEEAIKTAQHDTLIHTGVTNAKYELYETIQAGKMVTTRVLGRRRSAPGWHSTKLSAEDFFSYDPDKQILQDQKNKTIFRSLWNTYAAQADSNDMAMIQTAEIHRRLTTTDWLNPEWVVPHLFLHDAVYFYIREDYIDVAIPELCRQMEDTDILECGFDLPIRVSVELGPNRAEMQDYDWRNP